MNNLWDYDKKELQKQGKKRQIAKDATELLFPSADMRDSLAKIYELYISGMTAMQEKLRAQIMKIRTRFAHETAKLPVTV